MFHTHIYFSNTFLGATITALMFLCNVLFGQENISVPSSYRNVAIGDYFYEDGTVSPERIPSKRCVGIVYSTNTSDAEKARGWTHGMIVALENAGDYPTGWGGDYDHVKQECKSRSLAYNDINGFQHTFLEGDDSPGDRMGAFRNAKEYGIILPKRTSGWYLPSVGQWKLILTNLLGTQFEERLTKDSDKILSDLSLKRGNYWTSSEYGTQPNDVSGIGVDAWNICIYKNSICLEVSCKGLVCYTRPVASF